MTTSRQQKTPVGVLADAADEGLESTPNKEQIMTQLTASAAVPTRLDLDGFTTDVEPTDDGVNITFTDRGRWALGVAITRTDARRLAEALLDASAPQFGVADLEEVEEHVRVAHKVPVDIPVSQLAAGTVTDIWHFAQDHDMGSGDVMRAVETYVDEMSKVESMSPAQYCKRQRQQATN